MYIIPDVTVVRCEDLLDYYFINSFVGPAHLNNSWPSIRPTEKDASTCCMSFLIVYCPCFDSFSQRLLTTRPLRHMDMTWSTQRSTSLATTPWPTPDLLPPHHGCAQRAETPSALVLWNHHCRYGNISDSAPTTDTSERSLCLLLISPPLCCASLSTFHAPSTTYSSCGFSL